ncbi:MAG: FAD binding domain-containing protein [Candidatus Marinimicrobia bacterium]|nr:FAD binding domain-containing protein [Candidatus Neomarinimicrobiota bacterium]MCF7840104.1 FAD binding domain-containing protein [Candidatus Neomarinimicrobiota bacterium]MCF7902888.1 FAD binding domain-containing protein [Candidatus Neomarinimicrobiota bacterium]
MWSSIDTIHKPTSLTEAWELSQTPGTTVICGGTYLAAERDPAITGLIPLNAHLSHRITRGKSTLSIGAGVDVDNLVSFNWPSPFQPLAEAARQSCPSANIRNQRSIGGELGASRFNSELIILLHALNPQLKIVQAQESTEYLVEWNGDGIIREMALEIAPEIRMEYLRFAPIPSAAPFLCVAGVTAGAGCRIVVGGNVNSLRVLEFDTNTLGVEQQGLVLEHAEDTLLADHFGGVAYKRKLLVTALRRLGKALCT